MQPTTRTYIMGYWPLASNPKRPITHYAACLPKALAMIEGQSLVFCSSDPAWIQTVSRLCQAYSIQLSHRPIALENLPKFSDCEKIVRQTAIFGQKLSERPTDFNRDKGLAHYWRDYTMTDPLTYQKMMSIWHSKIDIINMVAASNPFASTEFAWIDASISRFEGLRPNSDFTKARAMPNTIRHYANGMRKHSQVLPLNASFLLGSFVTFAQLKKAYDIAFQNARNEAYPNDEETVLLAVIKADPNICASLS